MLGIIVSFFILYVLYLILSFCRFIILFSLEFNSGSTITKIISAPSYFISYMKAECSTFTPQKKELIDSSVYIYRELKEKCEEVENEIELMKRQFGFNKDFGEKDLLLLDRLILKKIEVVGFLKKIISPIFTWHIDFITITLPYYIKKRCYPQAIAEEELYEKEKNLDRLKKKPTVQKDIPAGRD